MVLDQSRGSAVGPRGEEHRGVAPGGEGDRVHRGRVHAGGAEVRAEGEQVVVTGRAEDHELIDRARAGSPAKRTKVTSGKEVYTLSVDKTPLDKLLAQLAPRLQLEFRVDRAAFAAANRPVDPLVSVKADKADLSGLLEAIFHPAGLAYERRGNVVEVRPAK